MKFCCLELCTAWWVMKKTPWKIRWMNTTISRMYSDLLFLLRSESFSFLAGLLFWFVLGHSHWSKICSQRGLSRLSCNVICSQQQCWQVSWKNAQVTQTHDGKQSCKCKSDARPSFNQGPMKLLKYLCVEAFYNLTRISVRPQSLHQAINWNTALDDITEQYSITGVSQRLRFSNLETIVC